MNITSAITILTDAGDGVGYGHLSRMTALAEAFCELGSINIKIVICSKSNIPPNKPAKYKEIFDNWHTASSAQKYAENSNIIIIDSYIANLEIYATVSKITMFSVFIDDFDRIAYPNGMVVRPNILRKPFWNTQAHIIKDYATMLLITIGGLDEYDIMPRLMAAARKQYPFAAVKVVISSSFSNIQKINSLKDENTEILSNLNAQDMQKLMSLADIAICGGGQTMNELCACGTPSAVICFADNQKNNIADIESKNGILYVGNVCDYDIMGKIEKALRLLEDKNTRRLLSKSAKKSIDTNGAISLAKEILDNYGKNNNRQ